MSTMLSTPSIAVGVLFSDSIYFQFNGLFVCQGDSYSGAYSLVKQDGFCFLKQGDMCHQVALPLLFEPQDFEASDFDLMNVVIGIDFHWERKEDQKFKGALKVIDEGKHLTAINILSLEDYLLSVISSEMKATSSMELLKAHAVISRSWLMAQKEKAGRVGEAYCSSFQSEEEWIRWYDREDHLCFDVCADDHCQRYQGISKAYTPAVHEAVTATRGEVMIYDNQICDARFSKCCGGVSERFENTWEPVIHPYLDKIIDAPSQELDVDLRLEVNAREWILSSPEAFCNTKDVGVLSEVLNDYDLETNHFFRWKEVYSIAALSALVKEKTGVDFGRICELIPIERGVSGRLVRLKIVGTLQTMIIGKELFIRKAFSPSHLYSSAFVVEKEDDHFIFYGAGWGHGVGLCQIGAAVMGARGYSYHQILQHYFKGCEVERRYV